jgi:hypothetical protein
MGTFASDARFLDIPAGADLIMGNATRQPNLVLYHHGSGVVVAAGQALEFAWLNGQAAAILLRNMLPYAARGGAGWLTVEPFLGTIAPGQHADLAVTFDASGLAGGTYHAQIEVSSNDPATPQVNVPALLTVLGLSALAANEPPLRFGLAAVAPTPARGAAHIAFTLTRKGAATAAIYDVAGRRVRTLLAGPQAAGPHALVWRGEDDHGARRAAGVYLLRLDAEEGQRTQRVVWIP